MHAAFHAHREPPMPAPVMPAPSREIYSVSHLSQAVRTLLEGHFPPLWVEGEISNLSRPASGHCYFTLKDGGSQVRCAMFRNRVLLLREAPANGMQVLLRARVSFYEARGDFQLIVESIEAAGEGRLRREYEALRARLATEGLFDEARKRPLPALPARIGVITSPSGAAIRDVLSTLARRAPGIPVRLYPSAVQGEGASAQLVAALRRAGERGDCSVLLLVRGGGSLEDLWAFNDETLARAIRACPLPVISGVGHEIDFTIADFAADLRAPTPTAAAELASPDMRQWATLLERIDRRLRGTALRQLSGLHQRLLLLRTRLDRQTPLRRLQSHAQRLDELDQRLRRALRNRLAGERMRLAQLEQRIAAQSPRRRLALQSERWRPLPARLQAALLRRIVMLRTLAQQTRQRLNAQAPQRRSAEADARRAQLERRLCAALQHTFEARRQRLAAAARQLDAVSPLATLGRGYAIVTDAHGQVLRDAAHIAVGDMLQARLAHGQLLCRVLQHMEPSQAACPAADET